MAEYIIANGQTLTDITFAYGDIVTVKNGGTLSNAVIPKTVTSVTLENGAILSGSIKTAKEFSISGSVDAATADLTLDISDRKPEDGLFLNSLFDTQSLSLTVSADQDKGTYRLFGDAADFSGTITVKSSLDAILGTLSLENNVLDYDITRYTLSLNEANEVCVTVSSNIPDTSDYVLLYKNGSLVTSAKTKANVTISEDSLYDYVVVLDNGSLTNSVLSSTGALAVYAGGQVTGLQHNSGGILNIEITNDTVVSGTNEFGSFHVDSTGIDGLAIYSGSAIEITSTTDIGTINLVNGKLTLSADIDGAFINGGGYPSELYISSGTEISNSRFYKVGKVFAEGCSLSDITVDGSFYPYPFSVKNVTAENLVVDGIFEMKAEGNNVFSNVTLNATRLTFYGNIQLNGTLTIQSSFLENDSRLSGIIDTNGQDIVLDLSHRTIVNEAMIDVSRVSENANFVLNFDKINNFGTFRVATGAANLTDTFSLKVAGNVLGTFDDTHQTIDDNTFIYTLSHAAQQIDLTVSLSQNAGASYKVWYWDQNDDSTHTNSLSQITIKDNTAYDHVTVFNGGSLTNSVLSSTGALAVYAGGQVTGLQHNSGGILNIEITNDTVVSGTNEFGSFHVDSTGIDGLAIYSGSAIEITSTTDIGTINLVNGKLTLSADIDGAFINGGGYPSELYISSGTEISNSRFYKVGKVFAEGCSLSDITVDGSFYPYPFSVKNVTAENLVVDGIFEMKAEGNNVFSNVTLNATRLTFYGNIQLNGTLTIQSSFLENDSRLSGIINANGQDIVLDLSHRTIVNEAIIDVSRVSENANFVLNFDKINNFGTFRVATGAANLTDTFSLKVAGNVLGTFDDTHQTIDDNTFIYTLSHAAQQIDLTVSLSQNAGASYKVWYWDQNDDSTHTNSLSQITIKDNTAYDHVTVFNGGSLTNSVLSSTGALAVYAGGQVTGLQHNSGGILNIEITNDTVVSGTNEFGSFHVDSTGIDGLAIYSGSAIEITSTTDIGTINLVNGKLTLSADIDGAFINGGGYPSELYISSGTEISNSRFYKVGKVFAEGCSLSDITVDGSFYPYPFSVKNVTAENLVVDGIFEMKAEGNNVFSNVTLNATRLTFYGNIQLNGTLTIQSSFLENDSRLSGIINANGQDIVLDLSHRTITSGAMISADHVRNGEFVVSLRKDAVVGAYKLATNAKNIGVGDPKGVYNWDTNKWDYQGSVIGDIDGIVEVRDENGILLANCTVNGDTEYFGRYNYTVRVDNNGVMSLEVGWNTREGRTYAADGYDNDTFEKASSNPPVVLPASGTKLTIDSADDVDWFQFTLDTTGRKSSYIGIDFKQWAGDLDLYLYDANGTLLDYAKSVTDNERISLKGCSAGTYYVKVEGYEGNVNEYKLAYSLPEPVVLTDDYENGDNKAHSYHLGKLSEQITLNAAISRTDDQDYYMFQLPKKGLTCDTITLTYDDEIGDLDLYLYGSNGMTLLATSQNTSGGTEQISLAGLKHGVYYVAVKAKDGGVGNYQLSFDVNAHVVNPDKYEDNNTLKKAKWLSTPNGQGSLSGLSIHYNDKNDTTDVDYFRFSLLEKGSADDYITLSCEVSLGDLDLEILNSNGEVVAYSRTAENDDTVSLKDFAVGDYYIHVYGYNANVTNNYTLSWNVTNSSLIPSDSYEGMEPIAIRENQTITGLSIAKPVKEDETRADTFKITLDYKGWARSKIILTDYRSDWEDGMAYVLKDSAGNVLKEGTDSEISLAGYAAGDYFLTLDTPNEDEYSEYSLIAQCLPDSDNAKNNTWSIFIYMAADNNLEGPALTDLLYMQRAVLPENVEVYVLLDRIDGYSTAQRDWKDTRVGKIRHSNGGAVAVEWMYFNGTATNTYVNSENLDLQQEWDTGNIDTLEAFLDWGMQVGRADNYALILYDHGCSLGYNSQDDTDGSMLSIEDVAGLLESNKYNKYKDLSVVAFDQCLMGSDVVISTMEGTVDYVVASEAIGYGPNLSVMYKVLLNSLETNMTPQEVSQKIVAACNCSGLVDLTMASFKTSDHTLSEALQAFGRAAKGFTRQDWVAICKSFAQSYNYGDKNWAYSDLGFFLSTLKEYSASISGTLLNATEALYDVVLNQVVDSTMITPTTYGSGLAVFNPVVSNDMISFYVTGIGQTDWGVFLRTAGQLAEDCTEFFVDTRTNLTFTDFSYSFEDEEVKVTYNLGAFYGNGVEYNGLYMDKKASFTISLDKAGIDGDKIHVFANNPDANITITLIQTEYTLLGPVKTVRRVSTDGVLSLAGVDPAKAGVDTEYDLIITSDRETTYDLSFVANWSSGSDYFDYSRSGSLGAQGNGSIDKATVLASGNYGGLVTYEGDADYYQLKTVYSDTLNVTVNGTGLTVKEYDADGFVQDAAYADGVYTITVMNGNYLRVEGNANLALNLVNSYSLSISDVTSAALAFGETGIQLPSRPGVNGVCENNQTTISVSGVDSEQEQAYYATDPLAANDDWTAVSAPFIAADGQRYYFKTVDTTTGLTSNYTSFSTDDMPTINIEAGVATGAGNTLAVLLSATFADDVALASSRYRRGSTGTWIDYEGPVTVSTGETIYFKATDVAGNETIESYTVSSSNAQAISDLAALDSTTSLTISEGSFTTGTAVFSGKTVTIQGDAAGSTKMRSVIGGVMETNSAGKETSPVVRDIDLTIEGGSFSNMVAGGNNIAMSTRATQYFVKGTAETVQQLSISGGLFKSSVVAGDRFVKGHLEHTGDIEMNISGGTFTATGTSVTMIAGGLLYTAQKAGSGSAYLNGNISLNITSGTFSDGCAIYGGCASTKMQNTISSSTRVEGSITITVDSSGTTSDNPISLCSIYVGSRGCGSVSGNAKLIFTGSGDAIVFNHDSDTSGQLWGSSSGDYIDPRTKKMDREIASVEGDRILSFTGFYGRLTASNIRAFSHIEFNNLVKDNGIVHSEVILDHDNYNLSGFENWKFEYGSNLSGNFVNDFAGDTLNLVGFSNMATGVSHATTLLTDSITTTTDTKNVFHGFGSIAAIQMDGVDVSSKAFVNNAWTFQAGGSNYRLAINETSNEMILTKLA